MGEAPEGGAGEPECQGGRASAPRQATAAAEGMDGESVSAEWPCVDKAGKTDRACPRRRAWAEEGSKARTRDCDSGLVLERVVGQGADDGWLGLRDTRFHIGNSFNKHLSRAHNTPGPVLSAGSSLGPSPGQPPLRGCRRNVDSQPWAPCLWGDGRVTCAGGGEMGQPPLGAGATPMGGA